MIQKYSIPSQKDLLAYIKSLAMPVGKSDLAKAFGIKGDDRIALKDMLRALEKDGMIVKQPGGDYTVPDGLPHVAVLEITDINLDGDVFARPVEWDAALQGPPPLVEIRPDKKGHGAGDKGDRVLTRLHRTGARHYEGHVIRKLDTPRYRALGLVMKDSHGGFVLHPTDRKAKYSFDIAQADLNGATVGDLAVGEIQPARGTNRKKVRIVELVGRRDDPKAISLIAIHEQGLRHAFPAEVLEDAEKLKNPSPRRGETKETGVPGLQGREDLREVPLVTIDGADARDFDDAVFAEKTSDGGFHLIVAIADVSYYVRAGSALDKEAYLRGNSTYFPDRVVPMLPEALSNDLCSLRPHENRACLAAHLWIDGQGRLKNYKFVRGIMRSVARLVYEQVQAAKDGLPDDMTGPLMERVILPLYEAYAVLFEAREKRGALDLDLPERRIVIDKTGVMTGVAQRVRVDAHKLIEEFMILANVAAARALEDRRAACVYRVHEPPSPDKLDSAREFLESFDLMLPKGQAVKPGQINQILHKAAGHPYSHLVSEVILRSQAQAHYSPYNHGHYGLALTKYGHFTSPIRRYADLLVHRSLVAAYGLGPGALDQEQEIRLAEMAEHISQTERASMAAERSAVDRFTAAFLADKIGVTFRGRITGVTRAGLFVGLEESGADGIVPMRTLPDDYYVHDEANHALIGRNSGRIYRMGAFVTIRIREASGLTGSAVFMLAEDSLDGADIPGVTFKKPQSAFRPRGKTKKGNKRHKGKKYGRKRDKR